MAHELVIETKVFIFNTVQRVCIGIDGGRITAVKKNLMGDEYHDYTDYMALPGGVDTHTHMREPGCEHKEDFYTGTLSAAFGGTTTILDMPNTQPEVVNIEAFEEKSEVVKGKANVDYGLFAELISPHSVKILADHAIGFKLYMSETTGTEGIFEEAEKLLALEALAGKVVTVHAENPSLFGPVKSTSLKTHNLKRNIEAETRAVEAVLASDTPGTLNLAHLSTVESIEMARSQRARYEISPHHFLLNNEVDLGALGKVNPPLRHRNIAEHLFQEVVKGRVDIIASDHAPHTLEEKQGEFEFTPSGLPGVETRIPLLMALAKKDTISLETVQKACCENPARLFGLKKGHIAEGYDADLAIFDMGQVTQIKGENLHSKCGWTPFENFEAVFPVAVMSRGNFIIKDGQLRTERQGQLLPV